MISILLSLAGQHLKFYSVATSNIPIFLPPANEVWGKVIFLHLFVILFMGEVPAWGVSVPAGVVWSRGLEGVCLLLGDGCLLPGGCAWWRTPGTATAAGGTHPTGMHSC